jgi:hypothetical protein
MKVTTLSPNTFLQAQYQSNNAALNTHQLSQFEQDSYMGKQADSQPQLKFGHLGRLAGFLLIMGSLWFCNDQSSMPSSRPDKPAVGLDAIDTTGFSEFEQVYLEQLRQDSINGTLDTAGAPELLITRPVIK